jgi:hypothetical protein
VIIDGQFVEVQRYQIEVTHTIKTFRGEPEAKVFAKLTGGDIYRDSEAGVWRVITPPIKGARTIEVNKEEE